VAGNLFTARQGLKVAAALEFKKSLFRPMGLFTEDTFRVAAAIVMLQQ
jgi:hypothetical protein